MHPDLRVSYSNDYIGYLQQLVDSAAAQEVSLPAQTATPMDISTDDLLFAQATPSHMEDMSSSRISAALRQLADLIAHPQTA